jgi:hypothetical protein
MCKTFLLFILCSALYAGAIAQSNIIKTDLIRPLRGQYFLGYERKLTSLISVSFGMEAGDYASTSINGFTDYKLSGFGIIPEVRCYPLNKRRGAPLGFFTGIAFRYAFFNETYYPYPFSGPARSTNEGNVFNYGIDAGYKFRIGRVGIEVLGGLGGGVFSGFDEFKSSSMPYSYLHEDEKHFYRVELSVGYLFPSFKSSLD